MDLAIYETSRGYRLELQAVSPFLLEEIKAQIPDPDPPTYETTLADGSVQVQPHDESTLSTDEDRAQWTEYLEAKHDATKRRTKLVTMVLIQEGIKNPPEPDEAWEARMRRYQIAVPQDPGEKLLKFMETEVFGSMTDFINFQMRIMQAGGDVPEEMIERIEDSFRSLIQGKVAGLATLSGKPMAARTAAGIQPDGEGLGENSKRVSSTRSDRPSRDDRDDSHAGQNGSLGQRAGTPEGEPEIPGIDSLED